MARKPKTADFLSKAKALWKIEPVDVVGLGMKVYVRPLSAKEVGAITDRCLKDGKQATDEDAFDNDNLMLHITAASVVDVRGRRLIPEGSEGEFADLPARVYNPLQTAALRINGMGGTEGN